MEPLLLHPKNFLFKIARTVKISTPKGRVAEPIAQFIVISAPKWIGLILY